MGLGTAAEPNGESFVSTLFTTPGKTEVNTHRAFVLGGHAPPPKLGGTNTPT